MNKRTRIGRAILALAATAALAAPVARAQQDRPIVEGNEVTILVTAHPHNARTRQQAASLEPGDFVVRENGNEQRIISVKRASEAPPIIALLIQDDLISRVNNEIRTLRDFIRSLPQGSRVMTGYLTTGSLSVTQDFTTDLDAAARSLRIIRGSTTGTPFNPYIGLIEALRRFDNQPQGRRMVLMVSDGVDVSRGLRSGSPSLSIDLDRAIREAQRRGVSVFSFYSPSIGLTSVSQLAVSFGQGSLNRLADETGGSAFFSGNTFVSFSPYVKQMNESLGLQWLITYRSTSTGDDFRRIEVTTDTDVHLHYPAGYRPSREER